ncbi:MAG TPA: CmcJ/NvfI family oxidoreductase, partial [Stellaceae bacterium]|nr:CmcJ/NvfI family oxidoreductase [Stellaceae bacterium]
FDPPPGVPRSNTKHEAHRVSIHDLRPVAENAELDEQGFGVVRHRSAVRDFWDEDEVRGSYYPEVEAELTRATGATRVFIFDHTVRRHIPGADDNREGVRQPARRVHVDHTARSGPQRVRDLIPGDADELLKGRVQIINLWRPIRGPVLDAPLAVGDASSVSPQDLIPSDLVYRHRTGETYAVTYSPKHRWFYLSRMQADEALLIKCYDSKTDGRARFAPHTAFNDPTAPTGAPPRESIEVRTLVFHAE